MLCPVFNVGDTITCRDRDIWLTKDKEYTVLDYQPVYLDGGFTWPAYVRVVNDDSRETYYHAHRFVPKMEAT